MATQTRVPISDYANTGTWSGTAGTRYTLVDDHPDSAGTDILTLSSAGGGTISFNINAFTIPVGSTINSVIINYYDRKTAPQGNNSGSRMRIGAVLYNSSTHNTTNGSLVLREDTWGTDPSTASAWTAAGVNAIASIGFNSTDANPALDYSSIQIVVDYTKPVVGAATDAMDFAVTFDNVETTVTAGNVQTNPNPMDFALSIEQPTVTRKRTVTPDAVSFASTIESPNVYHYPKNGIELSPSAFIAASGENTTAQLTPPSGKTTGDFHVGRIADDENPLDGIDILSGKYTEIEWSLIPTSTAKQGDVFEFRITHSGLLIGEGITLPQAKIGVAAFPADSSFTTTFDNVETTIAGNPNVATNPDPMNFGVSFEQPAVTVRKQAVIDPMDFGNYFNLTNLEVQPFPWVKTQPLVNDQKIPYVASITDRFHAGAGSITVVLPPHQTNDILLIAIETKDNVPDTPSGWSVIPGTPLVKTNWTVNTGWEITRLTVFWKRAVSGSESNVDFTDNGWSHIIAGAFAVRGVRTSGNPYEANYATTTINSGHTETITLNGVTTTKENSLAMVFLTWGQDAAFLEYDSFASSQGHPVSDIWQQGTAQSDGGGLVVAQIEMPTPGSTGTIDVRHNGTTLNDGHVAVVTAFISDNPIQAIPASVNFGVTLDSPTVTVKKQTAPNAMNFSNTLDAPAVKKYYTIDLETGNLSEFTSTTGGANIAVNGTAAIDGSYGMAITHDGTATSARGDKDWVIRSNHLRFGFKLDTNTLTMGSVDNHVIFNLHIDGTYLGRINFILMRLGRASGTYRLWINSYDDEGVATETTSTVISDGIHSVEVEVIRETSDGANDGIARLFIDGVETAGTITNKGNYNIFTTIDEFRWGAVSSLDTTTTGTLYFDSFEINDNGDPIFGAINVAPNAATFAVTFDNVTTTRKRSTQPDAMSFGTAFENVSVTVNKQTTVQALDFATTFDNVSATIRKQVAPDALNSALSFDVAVITLTKNTIPADMALALVYGSPVVTRTILAVPAPLDLPSSLENSTVTVHKTANPAPSSLNVSIETVTVVLTKSAIPDGATFNASFENVSSTVNKSVTPEGMTFASTFDNVETTVTKPAIVQALDIAVTFESVNTVRTIHTTPDSMDFAESFDNVSTTLTKTTAPDQVDFAVSFEPVPVTRTRISLPDQVDLAVTFEPVPVTRTRISQVDQVDFALSFEPVPVTRTRISQVDQVDIAVSFEEAPVTRTRISQVAQVDLVTTFENVGVTVRKQVTADPLDLAVTFENVSTTRTRIAVPADSTSAVLFDNVEATVNKQVVPDAVDMVTTFDNVSATRRPQVAPEAMDFGSTFDSVETVRTRNAVPADSTSAVLFDNVTVNVTGQILAEPDAMSFASTFDNVSATVQKTVSPADSTLSVLLDNVTATKTVSTAPEAMSFSVFFDNVEVTITSATLTEPDSLTLAVTIDNVTTAKTISVIPDSLSDATTFEAVTTTVTRYALPDDATSSTTFDEVIATLRRQVAPSDTLSNLALDQVSALVTRGVQPSDLLVNLLFENVDTDGQLTVEPADAAIGFIFDNVDGTKRVQVVTSDVLLALGFESPEATIKRLIEADPILINTELEQVLATLTKTVIPDDMLFDTTIRMFVALPELFTTLTQVKLYSVVTDKTSSYSKITQQGRMYSSLKRSTL